MGGGVGRTEHLDDNTNEMDQSYYKDTGMGLFISVISWDLVNS